MSPLAFSGLRLVLACGVLLGAARLSGFGLPRRSDWWQLAILGLLGHCGYQLFFVLGLVRTSVTNSSLILGCLPIVVLLFNSFSRRGEVVGTWQWTGTALAFLGLYLVVGNGDVAAGETALGDVFMFLSMFCWGWYTVGSRHLFQRYTPLEVTASTTVVGTVGLLPFAGPSLMRLDWTGITWWVWLAVVMSGLLALSLAYVLWYIGVQRLGSARTAIYSNLVPVVAMGVAAIGLGEPIGKAKLAGATLILTSLVLTRIDDRREVVA